MSDQLFCIKAFILCMCLFSGGISDMYKGIVKNKCIAVSWLSVLLFMLLYGESLIPSLAAALLSIAAAFPLYKKSLIGAADIKLFALILSIFPSFYGLEILYISFLYVLLYALAAWMRCCFFSEGSNGKAVNESLLRGLGSYPLLKYRLPLAPFLLFGTLTRFIF